MTAKNRPGIPSLRRCNGRGFVELNGHRHYIGAWGAEPTRRAYERLVAAWLANGRRLPTTPEETTVVELCRDYWTHCERYFTRTDGTVSSSLDRVRQALRPLKALYGEDLARSFGPNGLRIVRKQWLDRGLARKTVNDYTSEIVRAFKWGVSHELIPASIYHSLATLEGLRAGRSEARETEPIRPVPQAHIRAVRPFLSRQVNALIDLQLLTGARPGEVAMLRPVDLDTANPTWTARIERHKSAHHGKRRTLYFGPKAQAILKQFMTDRAIDAYLFSPRDAGRERAGKALTHRRFDQKPTRRKSERTLGVRYTVESYRRAVQRACDRATVPKWSPNRLRHNAATETRKRFGLEAAQVLLGHSKADVTQIYAERDEELAFRIARERG